MLRDQHKHPSLTALERFRRAANTTRAAVQHTGVDHRGLDVAVPEKFLDCTDPTISTRPHDLSLPLRRRSRPLFLWHSTARERRSGRITSPNLYIHHRCWLLEVSRRSRPNNGKLPVILGLRLSCEPGQPLEFNSRSDSQRDASIQDVVVAHKGVLAVPPWTTSAAHIPARKRFPRSGALPVEVAVRIVYDLGPSPHRR